MTQKKTDVSEFVSPIAKDVGHPVSAPQTSERAVGGLTEKITDTVTAKPDGSVTRERTSTTYELAD